MNAEADNIKDYFIDTKVSTSQIVGYYLEYAQLETAQGSKVSVSAWRLYKRGAVVVAHGETPFVEPSTGQQWFAHFSGTVSETNRQIILSASNAEGDDAVKTSALWILRPYLHGMADMMAVKTQSDHGASRPITTSITYFRSLGPDPDLAKLVLEECGIFDRKGLGARAGAIMDTIDAARSVSATQLQLLGR